MVPSRKLNGKCGSPTSVNNATAFSVAIFKCLLVGLILLTAKLCTVLQIQLSVSLLLLTLWVNLDLSVPDHTSVKRPVLIGQQFIWGNTMAGMSMTAYCAHCGKYLARIVGVALNRTIPMKHMSLSVSVLFTGDTPPPRILALTLLSLHAHNDETLLSVTLSPLPPILLVDIFLIFPSESTIQSLHIVWRNIDPLLMESLWILGNWFSFSTGSPLGWCLTLLLAKTPGMGVLISWVEVVRAGLPRCVNTRIIRGFGSLTQGLSTTKTYQILFYHHLIHLLRTRPLR